MPKERDMFPAACLRSSAPGGTFRSVTWNKTGSRYPAEPKRDYQSQRIASCRHVGKLYTLSPETGQEERKCLKFGEKLRWHEACFPS